MTNGTASLYYAWYSEPVLCEPVLCANMGPRTVHVFIYSFITFNHLMCLRPYLSKNQLEKHQVISLIGFLQIHFDLQFFFVSNKVGDTKAQGYHFLAKNQG